MRVLVYAVVLSILAACGPVPTDSDPLGSGGACIVDNTHCYDNVGQDRCREIGATEGDVFYKDGESCSQNAFFQTCGDGRKYKVCP